jgi:hypothetical protein
MCLYAQLRSVLTAFIGALLIATVLFGECVDCGRDLAASPQSGECCNPDGHCKASPHRNSSRCVKEQSTDFVVVDQLGQVAPVLPPADFCTFSSTESAQNAVILSTFHTDYSPPEHHILNSALLI